MSIHTEAHHLLAEINAVRRERVSEAGELATVMPPAYALVCLVSLLKDVDESEYWETGEERQVFIDALAMLAQLCRLSVLAKSEPGKNIDNASLAQMLDVEENEDLLALLAACMGMSPVPPGVVH